MGIGRRVTKASARTRVAWFWVSMGAVLSAHASLGCARKQEIELSPVMFDAGPTAKPIDHLETGELVEGTEKVFGLALPKIMIVERKFDDVAYATAPVPPELLAKYVEARVKGGTQKKNAEGFVFDQVHVPGEFKTLRIVVENPPASGNGGASARLQLRDVTPPAQVDTPPDEESRWRAVGLKPNGEPLDRTKLK